MEKEQIIKLLSCFKFAMSFLSDEEKKAVNNFSNITLIGTPIFFSNDSIEYKVNNESLWQEAPDNPDVIRTPDDKAEWDMEKSEIDNLDLMRNRFNSKIDKILEILDSNWKELRNRIEEMKEK